VALYAKTFKELQAKPLVVNGISYKSPVVGCAFFQLGDTSTENGHWGGYAMDTYTAAIKAAGVY
jgi:hypothetical protein